MQDMRLPRERRLGRLRRKGSYFCIAALDHNLSAGRTSGIVSRAEIESLMLQLAAYGWPAVVLNVGAARILNIPSALQIIVQTVGRVYATESDAPRHKLVNDISTISSAGADGVSVQLDVVHVDRQAEVVAGLIQESHSAGLPVLLMLNSSSWDSPEHFLDVLRSVQELGPDLVKASPQQWLKDIPPGAVGESLVPAIFSGGPRAPDFWTRLELAAEAGFSGVCVGRNIFQADDVKDALAKVDRIFER